MRRTVTTALFAALLTAALPLGPAAAPASAAPSAPPVTAVWMEDCLAGDGHPVARDGVLTCHGGEFDGQPIDAG
ncbi:hypothetical protein [Streptomyces sp. NPDC020983]|uniref:hypothetical protein n=1 Tax=Streptomyces sp. NPDC020983 TaxID=3365106 RepID=UPI0037A25435